MNRCDTGYVLDVLLSHAVSSGEKEFFINLLSGERSSIFDTPRLSNVVPRYLDMFWNSIDKQGASRESVKAARFKISFDLASRRPYSYKTPKPEEFAYLSEVSLIDALGVDHAQPISGWWVFDPPADA
jgi:hypothetical protein